MRSLSFPLILAVLTLLASCGEKPSAESAKSGVEIYANHCTSCHGDKGRGVDEEYDEPLWGSKSVESLARYIHKSMPEDKEDTVEDEDAAAVAHYIFDAFYSPAAQARIRPPRVELLRLTNNQYRQSVADLLGSFRPPPPVSAERGLKGRYFNSEKMNKEKKGILERIDPVIDFDYGTGVPAEKMNQRGFSIRWSGSLLVPNSGTYEFRVRTRNGALLHLNSFTGDDDRDAFIDAYVSTGNKLQEKGGRKYLLGGRAYPIFLRYFSYQEKLASIHLEWKPPHGVWEPIPNEFLCPQVVKPVTVVNANFSPDDRSLGYERGSNVSKEWQEATTFAAIEVVNHIITHLRTVSPLNDEEIKDPKKLRHYSHQIAERAFRRPLTPEQKKVFVDSRFDQQSDPEVALRHSLLLVLTSPRFLYPGLADNKGVPDDFTIAARLALTLWDSLPDEQLRKAAHSRNLHKPGQVTAQVRRMVEDPRTRQKMRGFFHHWLAMDEREDLGKDPKLYPDFNQQIVADLRSSLERFVDDVVWSEGSDYRQLLLADYLYLNPRLADFYKASGPDQSGFVKVSLPKDQRAGIFTHPYLLSANAYHDNTSPIHRGVFLSRKVLGRLLKPPPEAVAFKNEEFDPSLTMREKVAQLTKKTSCMQCHRVINPIGFSLESFDAVGRFRTEDNKKPINTVSDYLTDKDEKVRITSAHDLANLAAGSEAAHRAFITHLFHHLTKQSTEGYGAGVLDSLREKFVDSGYNVQSLLVEITTMAATHEPKSSVAAASSN
jgi:cytochrome c553